MEVLLGTIGMFLVLVLVFGLGIMLMLYGHVKEELNDEIALRKRYQKLLGCESNSERKF